MPARVSTEMRGALRLARSDDEVRGVDPGALAWLPLVGAAFGAVAAAVAVLGGRWWPVAGGVLGLGVLRAIERAPATRLGLGLLAVEAIALGRAPVATQALVLVLAPALGAWSRVVQCHGGVSPAGAGATLVGRATFREFGLASVLAVGGALAAVDAVGLVAVLGAATSMLALRAWLHRRAGGMPPWGPRTSGRVAEAVVIVVLATIARGP